MYITIIFSSTTSQMYVYQENRIILNNLKHETAKLNSKLGLTG